MKGMMLAAVAAVVAFTPAQAGTVTLDFSEPFQVIDEGGGIFTYKIDGFQISATGQIENGVLHIVGGQAGGGLAFYNPPAGAVTFDLKGQGQAQYAVNGSQANVDLTSDFVTYGPFSGSFAGIPSFVISNVTGSLDLDNVVFNDGAVPEPATWAMMLAGFGLVGAASRRRSEHRAII